MSLDSLTIATQGLLSNDSRQFAAQGLLSIQIDIVTPPPDEVVVVSGTSGIINDPWQTQYTKKEKKKLRARITVVATIDDVEYKQVRYTSDLTVKVKDIDIQVDTTGQTPRIMVEIKK